MQKMKLDILSPIIKKNKDDELVLKEAPDPENSVE